MISKEELEGKITQELGIDTLPEEQRGEILARLGENILKKLTIAVLDRIPQEDHAEFDALLKSGELDKLHEFLSVRIPDLDSFMQEEIRKVIARFKELRDDAA